jgi:hypothetical protein
VEHCRGAFVPCRAFSQTRKDHLAEIRQGIARDWTQEAMLRAGFPIPEIECYPEIENDTRIVCECGYIGEWRAPES